MRRVLFLVLIVVGPARGERFTSPSGFSLAYPEGWRVFSATELKQSARRWNFSRGDDRRVLVIQNPSSRDVPETVQVEVYPFPTQMTEYAAMKRRDSLLHQFEGLGAKPSLLRSNIEQIGEHRGISMEFELTPPSGLGRIQAWHFWISDSTRTYTLGFAAEASRFESYREPFTAVIRSFKIEPVSKTEGIFRLLTNRTVLSILIAILLGLYFRPRRRKEPDG